VTTKHLAHLAVARCLREVRQPQGAPVARRRRRRLYPCFERAEELIRTRPHGLQVLHAVPTVNTAQGHRLVDASGVEAKQQRHLHQQQRVLADLEISEARRLHKRLAPQRQRIKRKPPLSPDRVHCKE